MKVGGPLKRTEFKRSAPMQRTAKPAIGKPRVRTCRSCKGKFEPRTQMQVACSIPCAIEHGAKITAMQKVKAQRQERAADKVKRESLKRKADHVADAQRAFNAFVRERDKDQPCICCGRVRTAVDGLGAHGWDCGHYRSTGSAPFHRFNEDNAHRQLVFCNRHGAGRAVDYRVGLIARIGMARVEALEADNAPRHYSVDDLKAIKAHYVAKLKQLKGTK